MKSKKSIKLVVSDVDATLLIPGNKLPTQQVVNSSIAIQKKGVIFCCATARSLNEMHHIYEALKLNSYLILEGGSRIYDLQTKKYVWKKNIDKNAAKTILNYFENMNLPYIFTENNTQKKSIKEVENWEINEILPIDLTREQIDKTYDAFVPINSVHIVEVGSFRTNDPNISCLHITDIHATKQYAIYELLKFLKIHRDNALGIGDNFNDIPLLSACGTKVAMGNAHKDLKSIADFITKPVWENGFSVAMEKYVL